ncbi:Hypothetical_protein [Hexamita inflata]|uniref:Hypothetical_protein n=1 Tax=Hexamita inflata TaxID=28002 RepID=A0AA86PNC9_9EUKA|nr:Hypothetical protein HINF_LOCUS25629 [Hexamita inflata]
MQQYACTTLPCLQGRCYFAYKGVGQLTYKGVPSCKTPLQASDKQHSIYARFLFIYAQPQIIQIRHFPKIHFGYIFAYKGVEIDNSLISKKIGYSLTSKVMQQMNIDLSYIICGLQFLGAKSPFI